MEKWSKLIFHAVYLVMFCFSSVSTTNCNGASVVHDIVEATDVTMPCNLTDTKHFSVIFWYYSDDIAVELSPTKLTVKHLDLKGRVTIGNSDGNMMLSNVRRSDAGCYRCGAVIHGESTKSEKWYKLNVIVPPEHLKIKCTTWNNTTNEDCSKYNYHQVSSMSCEVASFPVVSQLKWTKLPSDCSFRKGGTTVGAEDNFTRIRKYYLRNICEGRYCCQADFKADDPFDSLHLCVDIGGKQPVNVDTTLQIEESTLFIILAFICAVIFIVVVLIITLCLCLRYKRKKKQYPFGITNIPCVSDCEEKFKKKPNLTVEVNDDGVGQSTALTPFLGPNHTGQTNQHNIFNFIVNEAQDNNNVNRVKVTSTQDVDPSGEKSRTVEIYKKRESSGFLMAGDRNVQPGLYRRALSNSDVSKIVYSEIVDDNGKVKREIEIIKGFSPQEEPSAEDIDMDYLDAANAISLSPTTPFIPMQRQISNIAATASETDVRKPKLQRQATIESVRGNDDTWSHSYNSYRRPLKYQHSKSIDIDIEEVD